MGALTPVQSSNVAAVGWEAGTLTVRFHSGAVYEYYNVPEFIYNDLVNPEVDLSKGQYFERTVKRGGYKYRRVSNG